MRVGIGGGIPDDTNRQHRYIRMVSEVVSPPIPLALSSYNGFASEVISPPIPTALSNFRNVASEVASPTMPLPNF